MRMLLIQRDTTILSRKKGLGDPVVESALFSKVRYLQKGKQGTIVIKRVLYRCAGQAPAAAGTLRNAERGFVEQRRPGSNAVG